jgi:hypothetical protein
MIRATFLIPLLVMTYGASADPQPTATEVFHLRTECKKLGDEILEKEKLPEENGFTDHFYNYDPATNRCFVLIVWRHFEKMGWGTEPWLRLFDGQAGALIAKCIRDPGNIGYIGRRSVTADEACAWIQSKIDAGRGD